jgi:glycogen operon protein
VFISGRGLEERDERGELVEDDDLLLLLNAHDGEIAFPLPPGGAWAAVLDTCFASGMPPAAVFGSETPYRLQPRSLALLARPNASSRARTAG